MIAALKSLVIVYILVSCNPIWAMSCEQVFISNDAENQTQRLAQSVISNPNLSQLLGSRAIGRWRNSSDPGWQQLNEKVSHAFVNDGGRDWVAVRGRDFVFAGMVSKENNEITIEIDSFVAENGVFVKWGKKSEGLNLSFANLVGSLFGAIDAAVASDDRIKSIKIVAPYVVINNPLSEILEKFGFKRDKILFWSVGKKWTLQLDLPHR